MQPASEEVYTDQTPGASADLEDREAQQAARDAVMEIPLFPDLTVMLRKALGYGPHVEMLQHFCHWFHPRHPKMRNRWTLYKTYAEWERECGLGRRQVDRGRRTLRVRGQVTEKLGQYKRVHYRVDWVALARVLNLYTIAVQIDEGYDLEDELNLYTKGEQIQSAHLGGTRQSVHQSVQFNTGEHAGKYKQKTSLFQSGAEPAFAEPAPPQQMDEEDVIDLDDLELPNGYKRHSQETPAPSETTAAKGEGSETAALMGSLVAGEGPQHRTLSKLEANQVYKLLNDAESVPGRFLRAHLRGAALGHGGEPITLRDVAGKVAETMQAGDADLYGETVKAFALTFRAELLEEVAV